GAVRPRVRERGPGRRASARGPDRPRSRPAASFGGALGWAVAVDLRSGPRSLRCRRTDARKKEGDAPGCTTAAVSYLYVPARTLHAWMFEGDLLGTAIALPKCCSLRS